MASVNPPSFTELAYGFLMAVLEPSEWVCLSYIIHRGEASADGGRRIISLEEMERGSTSITGLVRDLGTGLSRTAIKHAVGGLEKKGLVAARYICPSCDWEQAEGDPVPPPKGRAKSPTCPNCKRALSRAYVRAALTAKSLAAILESCDPEGRRFSWDKSIAGYRVELSPSEQKKRVAGDELLAEADLLREQLWYPDLVEQCIHLAEGALKAGGKISPSRRVNGFYRPIVELQEKYRAARLIEYALEQTINHRVPAGRQSRNWWHYPRTICENNRTNQRFSGGGGKDSDTNAARSEATSLSAQRKAVEGLLRRARELNGSGDIETARKLLEELLSKDTVGQIAPLFNNDSVLAASSLREAFKQGVSNFVGIDPEDSLGLDYYPEWQWPDGLLTLASRGERGGQAQGKVAS